MICSATNPSQDFVFFTYDSPGFFTTDTLVSASALAFDNSLHPATSVDFIIASPLDPGFADVQITIAPFPGVPTVQDKFVTAMDLAQYGVHQFVEVAAPEPPSMAPVGVGLVALFILGRRMAGRV